MSDTDHVAPIVALPFRRLNGERMITDMSTPTDNVTPEAEAQISAADAMAEAASQAAEVEAQAAPVIAAVAEADTVLDRMHSLIDTITSKEVLVNLHRKSIAELGDRVQIVRAHIVYRLWTLENRSEAEAARDLGISKTACSDAISVYRDVIAAGLPTDQPYSILIEAARVALKAEEKLDAAGKPRSEAEAAEVLRQKRETYLAEVAGTRKVRIGRSERFEDRPFTVAAASELRKQYNGETSAASAGSRATTTPTAQSLADALKDAKAPQVLPHPEHPSDHTQELWAVRSACGRLIELRPDVAEHAPIIALLSTLAASTISEADQLAAWKIGAVATGTSAEAQAEAEAAAAQAEVDAAEADAAAQEAAELEAKLAELKARQAA